MFSQLLKIINGLVDPFVLMIIILMAVFELIVDRTAFKKSGMTKDAKVTTIISVILLITAFALFVASMF